MALTIAVAVLLFLGVAIELLCVVGMLTMENVFARLHFLAPTLLGVGAIVSAIILEQGSSQLSVKAALIWALLVLTGPVVGHATARAARVRQFDGWTVLNSEKADAE